MPTRVLIVARDIDTRHLTGHIYEQSEDISTLSYRVGHLHIQYELVYKSNSITPMLMSIWYLSTYSITYALA